MPLFAILGLLLASQGDANPTQLAWKWTPGQSFRLERQAKQKQTVSLKNASLNQQRESTWLVRFTVKESSTLQATFEKVQHKIAGNIATDGMDEPLADKLQGCDFTLTATPDGIVSKVHGLDAFWDKASGGDAVKRKALRDAYSEKAFVDAFADMLGPLPLQAVAPKDTWRRETIEAIPHFGSFRNTLHFHLEEAIDANRTLRYTVDAIYQAPKPGDIALFRIVKADLQARNGKGTLVFDSTKGRLVSHQRSMLVRGNLVIEANGRPQSVDFTSENTLAIRLVE